MLYIYRRKLKFLTKLQFTEIGLCKLVVKNSVDELATVLLCVNVYTCNDYLVYLVKLVKLFCSIFH